jgi:hypothetical protein
MLNNNSKIFLSNKKGSIVSFQGHSGSFFHGKKGVSEITSFMFLTLIVIVVSFTAYFALSTYLDESVNTFDRNSAESFLKKFKQETIGIMAFNNASTSMRFSFTKGLLKFNGSQVSFQSLVPYNDNSTVCFNEICYLSDGSSEKLYYNLSNGYSFSENFSLIPGDYLLNLVNKKTQNEIQIKVK